MKINETTDMWVVVLPEGHICDKTLSMTDRAAIKAAEYFYLAKGVEFSYLESTGWRCIPVTVTIKERPL